MKVSYGLIMDVDTEEDAKGVKDAFVQFASELGYSCDVAGPFAEKPIIRTEIYTDGGSVPGVGAWAYCIVGSDGSVWQGYGHQPDATNNQMELRAVIEALTDSHITVDTKVKIVSDSEYVIKGCTLWSHNWQKNGWVTKNGTPVMNKELWIQLIGLYKSMDIEFEHVKGHSGNQFNEFVHDLCTQAMKWYLTGKAEPPKPVMVYDSVDDPQIF